MMISRAIRNRPWTTLGVTGLVASSVYRSRKEEQRRIEDLKKKKVLILPFYRMKIVEEKSPTSLTSLTGNGNNPANLPGGRGSDKVIEMPVDELVTLIHEAASDPSIVSLYGIFGSGGSVAAGGWAHLEEVRNAIQVFATSHRQHKEPGMKSLPPCDQKALYAYSNTFANPMSSSKSMQDYFLASAFSQIHLQPQGDLNLFGLHATNMFFRDFLQKYGITVHVWKHGQYKNMANQFTHSHFTKEHYDNVAGILLPIHQHVLDSIYTSRHKQLKKYNDFTEFWEMVENAGSLPAKIAHQIGFVDYLPRIDPLDTLVKYNKEKNESSNISSKVDTQKSTPYSVESGKGGEAKNIDKAISKSVPKHDNSKELVLSKDNEIKANVQEDKGDKSLPTILAEKWQLETDLDHFKADAKISIEGYARQKALERLKEIQDWKTYQWMSQANPVTRSILALVGYSSPNYNIPKEKFSIEKANGLKEKIAVIKINGPIGEGTARKAEKALRKVKDEKDIKSVILRVDSPGGSINACETIYQEVRDLPQKVVVSFGNVSASGGYYISAGAERIFASPTTITGSIGVVMLRMDFRQLAKQYGITFDSIPTSCLSGSFDPFYPINSQMNENFLNGADRAYYRFKSLVSHGRDLDMRTVESLAKGRVWTGVQAQEAGLVDELGGLDRAVAYAQRNFTTSGQAQVIKWPPKKSLWDLLLSGGGKDDDFDDLDLPGVLYLAVSNIVERTKWFESSPWPHHIAQSITETSPGSLGCGSIPPFPLVTSGIMLTADETTAIRCLLEDSNVPQAKLLSNVPPLYWE